MISFCIFVCLQLKPTIVGIANTEIEVILLTPVFTTQGGPGCVAIQAIKKHDILK